MNVAILAAVGGVVVLTMIRWLALRALPSWVAKRMAHGDATAKAISKATFLRRLLFYYGAMFLFVAGWFGHAIILKRRAAELQRFIDYAGSMRYRTRSGSDWNREDRSRLSVSFADCSSDSWRVCYSRQVRRYACIGSSALETPHLSAPDS